jgi:hypothetical protein
VVKVLAEATLALVLFSDASWVGLRHLRADLGLCLRLLGVALPLTIGLGTLLALALPGVTGIWIALLIGAALAPTDAALGAGMMVNPAVPARIRRLINVESGLNDGIATPFVLLAIAGAATAEHAAQTGPGTAVADHPRRLSRAVRARCPPQDHRVLRRAPENMSRHRNDARTQIDLIWTASIMIGLQPSSARNGGSRTWPRPTAVTQRDCRSNSLVPLANIMDTGERANHGDVHAVRGRDAHRRRGHPAARHPAQPRIRGRRPDQPPLTGDQRLIRMAADFQPGRRGRHRTGRAPASAPGRPRARDCATVGPGPCWIQGQLVLLHRLTRR